MHRNRRWMIAILLLGWTMVGLLHGRDGNENVKIKGLITGLTRDTLTVQTTDGNVTVALTDDTKVQKPKGLGLRKTQMSFTALIPGLRVSVDGKRDEKGQLVAKTISFSGDDLKNAEEIQAGLVPTQQAVETNQENIAANKVQIASNREKIGANEQQIAANQQEIQDVSKRFSDLTEFDTKGEASVFFASGSQSIPPRVGTQRIWPEWLPD